MAEAQKMMKDPDFQAQMKKVTDSQGFKTHTKAQQEAMKDPKKMKEMEETMQKRLKEGNQMLEKGKEALEAKKKEEEGTDDDKKKVLNDDEDKKEAAVETQSDQEDIPDIPSLSLN